MCLPVGKPLWKSENRSTCGKWFWKVGRYQRGNHKPLIEDGQTTQWSKETGQKDIQRSIP